MNTPTWLPKTLELLRARLGHVLPGLRPPATSVRGLGAGPAGAVADRLRHMRADFEQATVRLGVIGESGSGKSSLINALVGRPVAPVGALIETTQRPQEVPVEGLTLVDLPGCGTPAWPKDQYVRRLRLREDYDGFILVTASRLKECDALLFEELARKSRKPFFVVRSHYDLAVAAHEEAHAREVISKHIRKQLHAESDLPVYLVSSVGEEHYDLEKLILAIRASLPEWKQVRFIMAAHAYGEETLARKREAAEKIVGVYAGLAAANALNPVPGLDVSVDVGLLKAMSQHVIAAYGLRPDQVESLADGAAKRKWAYQAVREVADRLTPYLTEKFVLAALRRAGVGVAVRNTSKWVPFVGTLVSAGVGYRLAYHFGETLMDDCERAAREVGRALRAVSPPS